MSLSQPSSIHLPVKPGGAGAAAPLFIIPGRNGATVLPQVMASHIVQVRPYYDGLRYPGLSPQESPLNRVEDLATYLLREIRSLRPHGPYSLCGHSFGGVVAYEIACQLSDQGLEVDALILWDSYYHRPMPFIRRSVAGAISELGQRLKRRNGHERRQLIYTVARNQWRVGESWIRGKMRTMMAGVFAGASNRLKLRVADYSEGVVVSASRQADRTYRPRPFPGDAVFFCASELGGLFNRPTVMEKGAGWDQVVKGRLEVIEIPGGHLDIWEEPTIGVLAEKTADWLRKRDAAPCYFQSTASYDQINI
jgi:thioesterase domain-containing protein